MRIIIFSKDRALQLDLCIRSLYKYVKEKDLDIHVIYKHTAFAHRDTYDKLTYIYQDVKFHEETQFKENLLSLVKSEEDVLFIVDDNIFVDSFSLKEVEDQLKANPFALGFSLRLGKNTKICYPLNKEQKVPPHSKQAPGIMTFRWKEADYDFGYPLELSSSAYRVKDIFPILLNCEYHSPNTLEATMDYNKLYFVETHPLLMCYEKSVAFCNPINKVQAFNNNRSGSNVDYSPDALLKQFEKGGRIDLEAFDKIIPTGAHMEKELKIVYTSISNNFELF